MATANKWGELLWAFRRCLLGTAFIVMPKNVRVSGKRVVDLPPRNSSSTLQSFLSVARFSESSIQFRLGESSYYTKHQTRSAAPALMSSCVAFYTRYIGRSKFGIRVAFDVIPVGVAHQNNLAQPRMAV